MADKGKASRKNSEVESSESEGENANDTIVEIQTDISSNSHNTRKSKLEMIRKENETDKLNKLTFEMVDSLKVCELKEQLKKLNLSLNGKKKDLQNTLKDYIRHTEKQMDEEDSDVESDEDEDESQEENSTDDSDDEAEEEITRRQVNTTRTRNRNVPERNELTRQSFTIKDVEESLSPFTGDDGLDINKWIIDFEDMATLLGWTDLQLFIYGKRMLCGSAKKYIKYESGVVSWKILKKRLKREFKRETNSALIHAQLAGRKRLPHESGRQYVYEMQEIASQGHVENAALIQHIIDGIQDDECNKSILYSSETLNDLKKKLDKYDLMKEKSNKKRQAIRKDTDKDYKNTRWQINKKVRCFSCGSSEHSVQNCNNKNRGPKCFKCNSFGHIAPNCAKSLTAEQKQSKVSCVTTVNNRPIAVKINGIDCEALIDTGSDVNLMRKDIYNEVGSPELCKVSRVFTGLGNVETRPIGKFTADVVIGKDLYKTEIYVVPTSVMSSKVLLGHELLKEAEVLIRKGTICIKRACSETRTDGQTVDDREDQPNTTEGAVTSQEDCEVAELLKVFYVSECEVDVKRPYKEKIEDLIKNYKPQTDVKTPVETKIILNCDNPVCQQPRRLAPKEKKVLDEQIQEWLDAGIIQESKSEYASPTVIVPKKSGLYRVCIDYRKLNRQIVRDRFPMPLIEDCIDSLKDARIFSVIDLQNGFFHVPVAKESVKYTSFVTPSGQYEFLKTPFGLCNSPTSFLRFVDNVFRDLIRKKVVFTYMDDLVIPGIDDEDAFNKLKQTLEVAAENGLTINWKKCQFLQERIEFLGHVIENGHVQPSPAKVKAVKHFPEPQSKKHVQSFLGLTGYFRKFIHNYAMIAQPLSNMLKGNQKFCFEDAQRRSFVALKTALASEPVLRIYQPTAVTELHTDASKDGYGVILMQKNKNENHFHPVQYMSRKTSDAERKYHSYELEVLAIVNAIKKFRVYLLGIKFKIVTDCAAFRMTLYKKDLPPRVARWALALEEFDFEVEHRPGERLKHVDALSRFPIMTVEDSVIAVIRKKQDEDERLHAIKTVLQREPYEDYLVENNILKKRADDKNLIVLPKCMYSEHIKAAHENGHFGVKKMSEIIKSEFYIPKLTEKLQDFVSCCVPCILVEKKKGKKEGRLMPIPKGDFPLCTYHVDHVGPMTATSKMYKHLFVVVDGFSKFTWLYPTKTLNAKEVIDKLGSQQITFGNPERIISDKGGAFVSTEFKDYCNSEGIEHITITTGVPRGNGQVERINRTLLPILTKLSLEKPDQWYKHVGKVQRSLNSTYQRSIGMSPFEALVGTKMRQQEHADILSMIEQEAVELFQKDRECLRNIAKENILKIQEENKRYCERRSKPARVYKEGDVVAIKRTQFGSGLKIHKKFLGPYVISQVKGNERYEVIKLGNGEGQKITTTAADHMKPYKMYSSGSEEESGMAECRIGGSSGV